MSYLHSTSANDNTRARHWFITENNPEGNVDAIFQELLDNGVIHYACWQFEMGEEGTLHIQAYVNFARQTRWNQVREILPNAYWQLCIDPISARDYCRKEESRIEGPYELGVFRPPAAKMNVWKELYKDVKDGRTDMELLEKWPAQVGMYFRGINTIRTIVSRPRTFKTKVIYLYGLSGVGKSRFVLENWPEAYWKQPDSIWWDSLTNHETVVLDDFYGSLPLNTLLRLLDRYPMLVQTKGSQVNFAAKRLIITSNSLPAQWYHQVFAKTPEYIRALHRRIDVVIIARDNNRDNWLYLLNDQKDTYLDDPDAMRRVLGLSPLPPPPKSLVT